MSGPQYLLPGLFILAVEVKWKSLSGVPRFGIPWTVPPRLLCPLNSPGKSTGVGCHALLQGIFPTQGLNPGLPHRGQALLPSERPGQPGSLQISLLWFWYSMPIFWGFPGASDCKDSTWNAGGSVRSLSREAPLSKGTQRTPVFSPGESHAQRSPKATVHGAVASQTGS